MFRGSERTYWMILVVVSVATTLYTLVFANAVIKQQDVINLVIENMTPPTKLTTAEVIISTNMGDITLELYPKNAPKTVDNFITLATRGFYDGTRFHRAIKDFMIQGGDPVSKSIAYKDRWGTGGPGYKFEDEFNDEKVVRGVIAMANAGPNTNGSQFFIVTTPAAPWLDGKHTVFGKVISGMDVVDKIESLPTDANDRPLEDVIVESVTVK